MGIYVRIDIFGLSSRRNTFSGALNFALYVLIYPTGNTTPDSQEELAFINTTPSEPIVT